MFPLRDASTRREEALSFLRQVKSEQLDLSFRSSSNTNTNSSSSSSDNEQVMTKEQANENNDKVKDAIKAYETALKEELNLRTIIPGVRIVAPNDASRREEDIAAAKQFLGWDIDILDADERNDRSSTGGSDDNNFENDDEQKQQLQRMERNKKLMQSRRRFDGEEGNTSTSPTKSENQPMSNGAKAILLTVVATQIALLGLLSLDPISANNVFTEIAGNPPENIPPSSWTQ